MGCTMRPPPALTLPSWGSTRTPRYTIEGCCSLTVKYCAKSSAISPDTMLLLPTYGSFSPRSRTTVSSPNQPTAMETSSLPLSFSGSSSLGFSM